MSLTIKKLIPADFSQAKELFWFFQLDDEVVNPVVPPDDYVAALILRNDFHVIVALQNGAVIGGLTAYELTMYKEEINEMFLYEIAVLPEHRKMGVAKQLIESLKEICVTRGIKEMYVGTSTDNSASMKLYRSTGGNADDKIAWFVYQV